MQAILGEVGEGAANAVSDVALVEAILVKTQRAARPAQAGPPRVAARPAGPYLESYNGVFAPATGTALRAFQADHVGARATAGKVAPGDATWEALVAHVPEAFRDLRVLVGQRVVYVQATAEQLQAKLNAAAGKTFTDAFRVKVNATIARMHASHGIAVSVDPDGDRRSFQRQLELLNRRPRVTNAGPGESNHNFGGATDLGFDGLRWLRANGTVVENENPWLLRMDSLGATATTPFWNALRAAGTASGAFRGPVNDRPHLQNWSDAGVSMAASLAGLLTTSGTMSWSGQRGGYSCDLGFGGAKVPVGSAAAIWNNTATVDAATITRLRAAAPPRPGAAPALRGARVPPVTAADIAAMRQALRRQFELADANWRAWMPL